MLITVGAGVRIPHGVKLLSLLAKETTNGINYCKRLLILVAARVRAIRVVGERRSRTLPATKRNASTVVERREPSQICDPDLSYAWEREKRGK